MTSRTKYLRKLQRANTLGRLLLFTAALCGLSTLADGQQPALDTRQPGNIIPSPSPPNVTRQVPLLLELTETVTQEVKPGVAIHFRVVEGLIDDGFLVVATGYGRHSQGSFDETFHDLTGYTLIMPFHLRRVPGRDGTHEAWHES